MPVSSVEHARIKTSEVLAVNTKRPAAKARLSLVVYARPARAGPDAAIDNRTAPAVVALSAMRKAFQAKSADVGFSV